MARLDDNTSEEVKSMMQSMAANDWQKRQTGIEQFHDLTIKNPDAVIMQMVKVEHGFFYIYLCILWCDDDIRFDSVLSIIWEGI